MYSLCCNHKVEFDSPRITEKPPLFGLNKWLDKQNKLIAKRFTSIVRKIESLYMQDAERQVKAAQKNVLADYRELNRLRSDSSPCRTVATNRIRHITSCLTS